MQNTRVLAFIGQSLRPSAFEAGQFVYKEGDEITTFKIVTDGLAVFVEPRYGNQIFAIVDPKHRSDHGKNVKGKILKYFGFEDSVMNHL